MRPDEPERALPNRAVDVLLVDRRPVMREGLRSVIEREPDLVVVGEAPTMRDARSLDVTPDVIVTDIDLPDAKYGAVVGGLRESFGQSSILVFSPIVDPVEVQSILAAGANGYLSETTGTPDLCTGIRTVAVGETYLHPTLGMARARARSQRASDTPLSLSPQEERVFRLLVLGHTNDDVARLCNISIRTAQTHRAHIQRKLDCRTRAELVEYARAHGIIRIDPQ